MIGGLKDAADVEVPEIAPAVPEGLSGRGHLRRLPVRAALAGGLPLPRLRLRPGRPAEEPRAHLRMPRLRPPDLRDGGHGDAPLEAAADPVVLGGAPDGNPLLRDVRAPAERPASCHVQGGLAARPEAPPLDGRP